MPNNFWFGLGVGVVASLVSLLEKADERAEA